MFGSALKTSTTGPPSGVCVEFVVIESDVILHPLKNRLSNDSGKLSVDVTDGFNDDE